MKKTLNAPKDKVYIVGIEPAYEEAVPIAVFKTKDKAIQFIDACKAFLKQEDDEIECGKRSIYFDDKRHLKILSQYYQDGAFPYFSA